MPTLARQVYVISDLHLGGVYPDPATPGDQGFRICTHTAELVAFVDALSSKPVGDPSIELVIDGDLVDFLAERESNPPYWVSFTPDQTAATRKLEAIVKRDHVFFEALRRFLERGHRLVLLLGNHDIELSLPQVRNTLTDVLRAGAHGNFEFLYDGEAYLVGDALIEHGNRYDKFNVVNHDSLRHIRSLLSRRQPTPEKYVFRPPPGSWMVARVINPIKEDYRFVDLLKPETGAVIPLLLAIEPGYRSLLAQAATLVKESREHRMETAALPSQAGDIAYTGDDMGVVDLQADISAGPGVIAPFPIDPERALREVLAPVMGHRTSEFLDAVGKIGTSDAGGDISFVGDNVERAKGFARLVRLAAGKAGSEVEGRLPLLRDALRALQNDHTFDTGEETAAEYLNAAQDLASNGIKHVVFGHTHMAKRIQLKSGGYYLNSGTWANVLRFPVEIVSGSNENALGRVREFVRLMTSGDFSSWTLFQPTYVRLDVGARGEVTTAELCRYTDPRAV